MSDGIERTIARDLTLFDKVTCLSTLRRLTKDLNIRYLAGGSYSQVYSLKVRYKPAHHLVLKLARLDSSENHCDEWTFAKYLNRLIKVNQGPHFLYAHKLLTFTNRSYCFIQDKAEFDLTSILEMKLPKAVQVSLFVQLMVALYIIQSRYQIAHRDVKSDNIYLTPLPEPTKVTYDTDFGTFTLTLKGYWLYLGDFNVSYSFHPSYTQYGLLGDRNAKLVRDTLVPIKTRATRGPAKKIFWSTGQVTNRLPLRLNMTFAHQINTYDPYSYPPFEFIDDVVDACRTFIGGPRCLLEHNHPGLCYLDSNIRKTLSILIFSNPSYRNWTFDVNKGFLCNAGLLLRRVWTELMLDDPGGDHEISKGCTQSLHYDLKGLIGDYL